MKRNMDIIRLLLLQVEGDQNAAKQLETYPPHDVTYNAKLLVDAGLIEGDVAEGNSIEELGVILNDLTWAGHDFLDAARDDTVWRRAREKFMKPTASFTFEIVKEWLKVQIAGQ